MSVLNENTIIGASAASTGGYEINHSLRFNNVGGDGASTGKTLARTPSVSSNRRTWTVSMWHKRGDINHVQMQDLFWATGAGGGGDGVVRLRIERGAYGAKDTLWLSLDGPSPSPNAVTKRVFRDASAWMHIVLRFDTTQSTVTDRARIYINGEVIPSTEFDFLWSSSWSQLAQNSEWAVNEAGRYTAFGGTANTTPDNVLDGYLADIAFVDGQSLGPDSFGETGDYGEWKPIDVSGLTFGTNGFHLDFADSSAMGNDANGSNNFTLYNITANDQMLDSPTNNFATLNSVDKWGSTMTLSEGNLKQKEVTSTYGSYTGVRASIAFPKTGKWYIEYNELTSPASTDGIGGFRPVTNGQNMATNGDYAGTGGKIGYLNASGLFFANTSVSFGAGDILMFAYDSENGKTWLGKNGTWISSGNPSTAANPVIFTEFAQDTFFGLFSRELEGVANFGADSSFAGNKTAQSNQDANGIGDFYYAPPTGFLALCTQNLPEPTVIPSEHFNTVLYTGNGANRSISGVGFGSAPDFVWIKNRDGTNGHQLLDVVRGATKHLSSNTAQNQSTDATGLTSFDSDGFSLGTATGVNTNGDGFVAWNWKAGGSASTLTTGTIDSVVSANPSAGFSIVKYVGNNSLNATIAHGLSQTPTFIITKNMTNSAYWATYLSNDVNVKYYLNASSRDGSTSWITPASSLITLSSNNANNVNESGSSYINYCFHSVDGHSRVGQYTGNGSDDGTFVNCGFRPKYVLIRRNLDAYWNIFDTERGPYNVMNNAIFANGGDAENVSGNWNIDLLSNGFRQRNIHDYMNDNGETFFFIAFAETPFKFSNAR